LNTYQNFLKGNGFTYKLVESISKVGINNRTDNVDFTVNSIYKLNHYLQNNFLNTKLYDLRIYEIPLIEEELEEENILFTFKEIYIRDLTALIYNKKVFLKNNQMIIGGQDRFLYRIIHSIENQSQNIKLVIIDKFDKNREDLITNIYITFTIEEVTDES